MKSSSSFHNSSVCEQLQASILKFFQENYAASCDVEIDAIICLSLLDTSDQNVIKIHEVLPKHVFKFGSASTPQKSVLQESVSSRRIPLKIPPFRASHRRKPLKVNISRQIQRSFSREKYMINSSNAVGKSHVQSETNVPPLPPCSDEIDSQVGVCQDQGHFDSSTDLSEQQYLLDDLHLEDTKIKSEPIDSEYELGRESSNVDGSTEVTQKEKLSHSEGDTKNYESENLEHEEINMYITDEGTIVKAESDCDSGLTVESLVNAQNDKLKSRTSYEDEQSITDIANQEDFFDARAGNCNSPTNDYDRKFSPKKSRKPMDFIILHSKEKAGNFIPEETNSNRDNELNDSTVSVNPYNTHKSHIQNNSYRPFTKSLLAPELFKRKQHRPRKLNRDLASISNGSSMYETQNLSNQIELDSSSYVNPSMSGGNDKVFSNSFMKILDSTPEQMKLASINKSGTSLEKNFFCDQCGTGFSSKKSKLRHERHTCGSRSFPCSICSKSFSRADSKQRHLLNVHGLKILSQSQMARNKNYYLPDDLNVHNFDKNGTSNMQQNFDQHINQNEFVSGYDVNDSFVQEKSAEDMEYTENGESRCIVDLTELKDSSNVNIQDENYSTENQTS